MRNATLVKDPRVARSKPAKDVPVGGLRHWMASVTRSPWRWATVSCVLLAISGGFQIWQDWRFQTLAGNRADSPFPLKDLPRVLGTWRALDLPGGDGHLDPQVAKIAGAKQDVMRKYQDENTGETIEVLVIYGMARFVFAHAPDVCYPANGFKTNGDPTNETLAIPGSAVPARYHMSFFAKRSGSSVEQKQVAHTFLHNGEWREEMDSRYKLFRAAPAMFKIQLDRPGDPSLEKGPLESLLTALIVEINRRVAASPPAA
jgi:hypothetical protein